MVFGPDAPLLHRLAFSATDWNLHIVRASSDDEGVDNDHYLYASVLRRYFAGR
jgi:hypothetical protein